MLVAEKNYLYNYEQYAPVKHNLKENKRAEVKKVKKGTNTKAIKMIFNLAVIFLIGFVIVFRYAALTGITNTIDKQKKYLVNLEKTNTQLRAEMAIDLRKVDEISKNKLGMDRPYKYQIVYIETKDENANKAEVKVENKFNVVQKFEKIVEYLY